MNILLSKIRIVSILQVVKYASEQNKYGAAVRQLNRGKCCRRAHVEISIASRQGLDKRGHQRSAAISHQRFHGNVWQTCHERFHELGKEFRAWSRSPRRGVMAGHSQAVVDTSSPTCWAPVQEWVILSCLVLSCLVLSCRALSCLVLSCLALYCLALRCLALHCLTLPCLALPCLA